MDRPHGVRRVLEAVEEIAHECNLPAAEELPGIVKPAAPVSGSRPPAVYTTASFASLVFEVPSACFPRTPSVSSFRIGMPVPSMERDMRGSSGLPSSTSSRAKHRAASPSAWDQRCRELDEGVHPGEVRDVIARQSG